MNKIITYKKCKCGSYYEDKTDDSSQKYCNYCLVLSSNNKRPVILIKGNENEKLSNV